MASSYAQVSQRDLEENLTTSSESPARCSTYSHIEEARDLTWCDSFYDGKHGIVAAFDRAAFEAGQYFLWKFLRHAFVFFGFSIFYWILAAADIKYSEEQSILDDICGFYMLFLGAIFCLLAFRGKQAMLSQHIAITTEGIRIDNGTMVTVTVPFEHIHSCEAYEQKYCCKLRSAEFQTVAVHRSAAPLEQFLCHKTRKLELHGILRAQDFVDLVNAMKDSQDNGTYEGVSRVELQQMD